MMIAGLVMAAASQASPPGITILDSQGREISVTDPVEIRYARPMTITEEELGWMPAQFLSSFFLAGRRHEPIARKVISRSYYGNVDKLTLFEADRVVGGHCVRTGYEVHFHKGSSPLRALRRWQQQWLQPGEACEAEGQWIEVNRAIGINDGVRLLDLLASLQERAEQDAELDVRCQDNSDSGRCAGDQAATFAALDLRRLYELDAPSRSVPCQRAHLQQEDRTEWWLRYCPDEDGVHSIRMTFSPPPPPAMPLPPTGHVGGGRR